MGLDEEQLEPLGPDRERKLYEEMVKEERERPIYDTDTIAEVSNTRGRLT